MSTFAPLQPLPLTTAELAAATAHLQALVATAAPASRTLRLVAANPSKRPRQ